MTDRKAMEQQLRTHWEGCDEVHPECKELEHRPDCALLKIPSRDCDCQQEESEAARAAWMAGYTEGEREAIENQTVQQQEPVYWEVRCTAHPKWMRVDEQQFDEYVANGWEGQRLYAAPPRREWVGLTDEDIFQMGLSNYIQVIREAEAKLKEKNA